MIEKINIPNISTYAAGLSDKTCKSAFNTNMPSFKGLDKDAVKLTRKAIRGVRGNTNILSAAYEEGQKLAEKIFNEHGLFETTQENLLAIFKQPQYKSTLALIIVKVEKYISQVGEYVDPELPSMLTKLKQALEKYTLEAEEKIIKGVYTNTRYDMGKKFAEANGDLIKNIRRMIINTDNRAFSASFNKPELRKILSPYFSASNFDCIINDFIRPCPPEILPKDGIFYHGTQKAGKILKNGFTPFVSKQLKMSPRELGAGIYATPDQRVAAFFAGLKGSILPVKLDKDAKVVYVSEDSFRSLYGTILKFISERFSSEEFNKLPKETQNALMECFIRDLFKKAGYDAAYMPRAMKGGGLLQRLLAPDVNDVIGRNQSQLVIFSPEKAEILPKSFLEKIKDIKLKIASFIN